MNRAYSRILNLLIATFVVSASVQTAPRVVGAEPEAIAVQVTYLDGETIEGQLQAWQGQELTLRPTKEQQVASSESRVIHERDLLMLRFANGVTDEQVAIVELVDGTKLPSIEYTVSAGVATIRWAKNQPPVRVPVEMVRFAQLKVPTVAIAAQWKEIQTQLGFTSSSPERTDTGARIDSSLTGDLIVIRKEDAIDYLPGALGDISDATVQFTIDGEKIDVGREKVDGVAYFRLKNREFKDPICVLRADGGVRLQVRKIELADGMLHVELQCGVSLQVPPAIVESADFSAGKVQFLDELTPRQQSNERLLDFPESAELAKTLFASRFNQGFVTRQATVRQPVYRGERIIAWDKVTYTRSIGLSGEATITYQVPAGFKTFRAEAAFDAAVGQGGIAHLSVIGDGQVLWEQQLLASNPPSPIRIDVAGVHQLTFRLQPSDGRDLGDRVYVGSPQLLK